MTVSGKDVVRQSLEANSNIVEVEVEYRKGNKAKYNLLPGNSSSRQSQIERLLSAVNWDKVEEVEIEYVDGYKEEIDLEAKPRKNKKNPEAQPQAAAMLISDTPPETEAVEAAVDPIVLEPEEVRTEAVAVESVAPTVEQAAVHPIEQPIDPPAIAAVQPILVEPEAERKSYTPPPPLSSAVRHYSDSLDDGAYPVNRPRRRRLSRKLRKPRKSHKPCRCRKARMKKPQRICRVVIVKKIVCKPRKKKRITPRTRLASLPVRGRSGVNARRTRH